MALAATLEKVSYGEGGVLGLGQEHSRCVLRLQANSGNVWLGVIDSNSTCGMGCGGFSRALQA
jgi:hypothetical protein